jgi:hypothetical protein
LLLVPSDCVCACACRGYDWASMLIRSRMLVSTRLASSLLDRPSSLGQLPGGLQGGASTAWIVSSITWAGARQLHAFAQALSALNPCRRMAAQVWLHRFGCTGLSAASALPRRQAVAILPQPASGRQHRCWAAASWWAILCRGGATATGAPTLRRTTDWLRASPHRPPVAVRRGRLAVWPPGVEGHWRGMHFGAQPLL